MIRVIIICCILLAVNFSSVYGDDSEFSVAQEFVLHQGPNGVTGRLQVLMDSRLTPGVRREMWGIGDWSFVLAPESPLFKDFSASSPHNAKLEIKNKRGQIVAEYNLERPLAELKEWNPTGDPPGYLLTLDFSVGAGSYNGLTTTLLQVTHGSFHDISALNGFNNRMEPIRLTKTLKSGWRTERSAGRDDILFLSSHPASDGTFVTQYIRYRFDGSQWHKYERQKKGLWETGQPFPPESAFPNR